MKTERERERERGGKLLPTYLEHHSIRDLTRYAGFAIWQF